MQEYRIDIKVRNNIILQKIEQSGYKSVADFCHQNNFKYHSQLGEIINMKTSPLNSLGEFRPVIVKVAEALGCDPLDLFSDTQLHTILKTNKRMIAVGEAEMKFMIEKENNQLLLEDSVLELQKSEAIEDVLEKLTPREEKVLQMRYGLGEYPREYSLEECGIEFGVTRERIRQMEAKALRKLRHPRLADQLKEFLRE